MNPFKRQASFPLGLVLYALILTVYKAFVLTNEMGTGRATFWFLMGLDSFYLALLVLVALLAAFMGLRLLRVLFWFLLLIFTIVFLIDTFVLLALDDHAPLFDIGRYSAETGVVLSFFDIEAYTAIVLLLVSVFISCAATPVIRKSIIILLLTGLIIGSLSVINAPAPLLRYAMLNPASLMESFGSQRQLSSYSSGQIKFYDDLEPGFAKIPAAKPDIVLLVVESLSSINSKMLTGDSGWLDGFDRLAENGLLFRNFFANHQASEGGVIALLGGYPPIHFPTATPYMFNEFAIQPSVVSEYRQQGYFLEFLTNSDLSFIGLNHFLDGIGFNRSRGRDEVDAMKMAPRVVQDAPSDDLLYNEALLTIQQLSTTYRPFLLTLATTSTHLPYRHPRGGPDTPHAVWDWSMRQLELFYRQLSKSGYFEHGILIVTGDHRQMRPLTKMETERYGASARARVPLLLIGKEYAPATIDERFFQQSDLLRLLGAVQQQNEALSPYPVWVERYNRKYGRIELIDKLGVFDEADQGQHEYRLNIPGNRIEWLGEKPRFARTLEAAIHTQRSRHQANREANN